VTATSPDAPTVISVDVSAIAPGTNAEILFRVGTGNYPTDSSGQPTQPDSPGSVSLTNVMINGQGPTAAPEPASAVLLLGLGLPLLMRYTWVRRHSRPHVV
ncbi:MAG TPA: hypothetical protein VGY58_18185, partial [Gemmataceae bacterium]|nr:hypothetical protein [Gemmataceae bacterium]